MRESVMISVAIKQDSCSDVFCSCIALFCLFTLETEELLHTTNLHNNRTSLYDSNNYKKLMVNGNASSNNTSLIDDKLTIQSGGRNLRWTNQHVLRD